MFERLRVFDNVWRINDVLIFKRSCLHFIDPTDYFLDVSGTLEGETLVGKCIPDTPIFHRHVQSQDSQQSLTEDLELVQNWREPIYRLLKCPEGAVFITNKQPTRQED
jgi:hypothetical protein